VRGAKFQPSRVPFMYAGQHPAAFYKVPL